MKATKFQFTKITNELNRDNFSAVYHQTYNIVYQKLLPFVGENDYDTMQELIQRTYNQVFNKMYTFEPKIATVNTFVGTYAYYEGLKHYKRNLVNQKYVATSLDRNVNGKEEEKNTYHDVIANTDSLANENIEVKQQREIIRQTIKETLKGTELKVFMLYYYTGLLQSEISEKYNLPLSTVKVYVMRAKEKMKVALTKKGLNN